MKKLLLSAGLLTLLLSFTFSGAGRLTLQPVWVRVGDSQGAADCECGIASVETAEFSPDGKYIVAGSKKGWEVILWETVTGKKVWEKKMNEETEAVAFSRDGRYVAVGGEDKTIHILDASNGAELEVLPLKASIDGMRFSNKGSLLIGGDEIGLIHVWRTTDWKETHTVKQGLDEGAEDGARGQHADVNSVNFTRDDQYVATAGRNSQIKIWRTKDMQLVRTITGHTGSVKSNRISPDGRLVASASASPDTLSGDNTVRVWDFKTGKQLALFKHRKGMEAVEFSPTANTCWPAAGRVAATKSKRPPMGLFTSTVFRPIWPKKPSDSKPKSRFPLRVPAFQPG